MSDLRWFTADPWGTLIVPQLRRRGLSISLEGHDPSRLAVAMSAGVAVDAWHYARVHRCPLVLYLWDLPPWRLGRGRPDFVWPIGGRWLHLPRLGHRFPERRKFYNRVGYIARHAAAVWVPSHSTQQSVAEYFGLPATLQPYCYDSRRFVPDRTVRRERGTLLSISRMQPSKNHAAVIRAAALFDPPLQVRLIGRGPTIPELQSLADDLGVSCVFESGLSDEDIVRAYQKAEVVVCPSRFEGFGLTPIEALACDAPVVASDIPPHREFLRDSVVYFTLDDDASLFRAIQTARWEGPRGRGVLEQVSIQAAAERFDIGFRKWR